MASGWIVNSTFLNKVFGAADLDFMSLGLAFPTSSISSARRKDDTVKTPC